MQCRVNRELKEKPCFSKIVSDFCATQEKVSVSVLSVVTEGARSKTLSFLFFSYQAIGLPTLRKVLMRLEIPFVQEKSLRKFTRKKTFQVIISCFLLVEPFAIEFYPILFFL